MSAYRGAYRGVARLPVLASGTRHFGRKTTAGPPTTGMYRVGDMVVDLQWIEWICVTAGTPGQWGPLRAGVELARVTSTSQFAPTTTEIDMLSVNFDSPWTCPVRVEALAPYTGHATANAQVTVKFTDNSNVLIAGCLNGTKNPNQAAQHFGHLALENQVAPGSGTGIVRKFRSIASAGTGFVNLAGTGTVILKATTC